MEDRESRRIEDGAGIADAHDDPSALRRMRQRSRRFQGENARIAGNGAQSNRFERAEEAHLFGARKQSPYMRAANAPPPNLIERSERRCRAEKIVDASGDDSTSA
jgi:hypothetical protein